MGAQETAILTPMRHWFQYQAGLAKTNPGQGHRTNVPFVLWPGPLRKSWVSLDPHRNLGTMAITWDPSPGVDEAGETLSLGCPGIQILLP